MRARRLNESTVSSKSASELMFVAFRFARSLLNDDRTWTERKPKSKLMSIEWRVRAFVRLVFHLHYRRSHRWQRLLCSLVHEHRAHRRMHLLWWHVQHDVWKFQWAHRWMDRRQKVLVVPAIGSALTTVAYFKYKIKSIEIYNSLLSTTISGNFWLPSPVIPHRNTHFP